MTIDAAKLDYVVWVQTAFIGDVVLTTAAMARLQILAPHLKQFLITTQAGMQVASGLLDESNILIFDKRKESMFKAATTFRSKFAKMGLNPHNTALLQVHRSYRSSLLAKGLGFPTITYRESGLSFLAKIRIPRVMVFHEADRIALLLEGLGLKRSDILGAKPSLPRSICDEPWSQWRRSLSDEAIVIGIAPGSVWATKRWPLNYFNELIATLLAINANIHIALIGSSDERNYVSDLVSTYSENPRVFQFVGRSKLAELAAIMKDLSLLICNDSSPLHFASAANTPCVAIFGATVSQMGFGPLSLKAKVIEHQSLDCRPCSDHGPKTCHLGHFRCMKEITPANVLKAAVSILELS